MEELDPIWNDFVGSLDFSDMPDLGVVAEDLTEGRVMVRDKTPEYLGPQRRSDAGATLLLAAFLFGMYLGRNW